MDYKTILKQHLLSQTNIDFLINTILSNYRISNKAISKCITIITNNIIKDLENLERYPENQQELIEAIHFLNRKCYTDFGSYLLNKYPEKNVLRNGNQTIHHAKQNNSSQSDYTIPTNKTKQISEQIDEVIILSEEEKNDLLKKYNSQPKQNDFLSYLTNPMVLQMFSMMINQINHNPNTTQKQNVTTDVVIDEILDINQVKQLISKTQINDPNDIKPTIIKSTTTTIEKNDLSSDYDSEELEKCTSEQKTSTSITKPTPTFDLDNLSNDTLPLVEKYIKELVEIKNKYLTDGDSEMVKKIDEEKSKIIKAITAHKQKIIQQAKESETKYKNIVLKNEKITSENKSMEKLDLQFDPSNDFRDLKNIVINCTSESKVSEIVLVSYYLPMNSNNVNRFNNRFTIYFGNKVNSITIPPNKYEINVLLDYIKNQANFLEFNISKDNIVTIKNTMNMKFDLMTDLDDSVFPLLGFTEKPSSYKDKLFYSGNKAYNLECNQKVFFTLSRSTIDPIPLEFDKEITINKTLKHTRNGINLKQLALLITNELGQCYDFIMPFKMCFQLTYVD